LGLFGLPYNYTVPKQDLKKYLSQKVLQHYGCEMTVLQESKNSRGTDQQLILDLSSTDPRKCITTIQITDAMHCPVRLEDDHNTEHGRVQRL
jgi:hypothetical protein